MLIDQYAKIISISDEDNIAIIDPDTIFSDDSSNQIWPLIDGDFELTGTIIPDPYKIYHITYFTILKSAVNLIDLYIDLTMTITFSGVVTLRSMHFGNKYGDYMVAFTDITHNEDNTYTAKWNGKLNGSLDLTMNLPQTLCIYIDATVKKEITTISGNVKWSSASSGRELHYGDRCLIVNHSFDNQTAVIIS